MMEAGRDREMVDVIVKKIEAEEKAEQEQYLRSRYDTTISVGRRQQTSRVYLFLNYFKMTYTCLGGAPLTAGIGIWVPSNLTRYPPASFLIFKSCVHYYRTKLFLVLI